ncbi:MAG TPA: ATP-binding protein [Nitrososphaeraceae archaeon]|nr:ATP-binding protein [Nitrososphaeraceae archaeon]
MYGTEKANNAILQFVARTKERIHACIDQTGPSVMMGVESIKKERLKAVKRRGIKLRYVTEITKENIPYCKELMKISEIRHTDGIKGNFEVSDGKEYVAAATLQKAKPVAQLIYSNVMELVEQQQYLFDTLWNKSIPAEQKIMEIEQGIKPDITEIIRNPGEILKVELGLLESAFREIEIIFSTANVFHFQERLGILHVLRNVAAATERNVKIRILVPFDKSIEQKLQDLKKLKNFEFREIASSFEIKTKTLVIDRNYSLMMELKDGNNNNNNNSNDYLSGSSSSSDDIFNRNIGIAIYSNSKPIALSFISIFESLWQQSNLVEQLKQTDRMKDEFINIAAHELRTPVMPIIAGMELLEDKLGDKAEPVKNELEIVNRNATRLQKLAEDLLQINRIESGKFTIKVRDGVDIIALISDTIKDIEKKYDSTPKKGKISIKMIPSSSNSGRSKLLVRCDPTKVNQVVFNLLDNAMKFTRQGTVTVSCDKQEELSPTASSSAIEHSPTSKDGGNVVLVSITDTGTGIDPSIKERLFEKFVTSSSKGTGLGLYLSRKIIEAHNGQLWIDYDDNNDNNSGVIRRRTGDKGSRFVFSIPMTKKKKSRNNDN